MVKLPYSKRTEASSAIVTARVCLGVCGSAYSGQRRLKRLVPAVVILTSAVAATRHFPKYRTLEFCYVDRPLEKQLYLWRIPMNNAEIS